MYVQNTSWRIPKKVRFAPHKDQVHEVESEVSSTSGEYNLDDLGVELQDLALTEHAGSTPYATLDPNWSPSQDFALREPAGSNPHPKDPGWNPIQDLVLRQSAGSTPYPKDHNWTPSLSGTDYSSSDLSPSPSPNSSSDTSDFGSLDFQTNKYLHPNDALHRPGGGTGNGGGPGNPRPNTIYDNVEIDEAIQSLQHIGLPETPSLDLPSQPQFQSYPPFSASGQPNRITYNSMQSNSLDHNPRSHPGTINSFQSTKSGGFGYSPSQSDSLNHSPRSSSGTLSSIHSNLSSDLGYDSNLSNSSNHFSTAQPRTTDSINYNQVDDLDYIDASDTSSLSSQSGGTLTQTVDGTIEENHIRFDNSTHHTLDHSPSAQSQTVDSNQYSKGEVSPSGDFKFTHRQTVNGGSETSTSEHSGLPLSTFTTPAKAAKASNQVIELTPQKEFSDDLAGRKLEFSPELQDYNQRFLTKQQRELAGLQPESLSLQLFFRKHQFPNVYQPDYNHQNGDSSVNGSIADSEQSIESLDRWQYRSNWKPKKKKVPTATLR